MKNIINLFKINESELNSIILNEKIKTLMQEMNELKDF